MNKFLFEFFHLFLSHPLKFIGKISPKRIVLFFHVFKTEGIIGVVNRINVHFSGEKGPNYTKKLDIIPISDAFEDIDDYESIVFEKTIKPLVSIIIPVANQFNYTYNCLKSIHKNSGDKVAYEIIIANDSSDDITVDLEKIVSNISVVTTTEKSGFIKNCNHAAKQARGKYTLFLNNDTQVQENWLLPLVELAEKDSTIGIVGSKLLFENGKLQEAGGVVWDDGSAWNYGRMNDPSLPEFNYVKEVDYVSGAALIIKTEIWKELNGFDESFAPAYCEDSDLCFSARKLKYKVMYQPVSSIVHFEGITCGNDISTGQKQYQAVNQKKFYEKWKTVLQKEHFPNGTNIFLARDRIRHKKTLLVIDHHVPQHDRDAGSRTVFQYLKLFIDVGFNVKFLGDNFLPPNHYTKILEQIGIEVLYADYDTHNWKTWLKTNGQYIDFVFLNRPHISIKYIDMVKKHTKAKIFYYGHDLHFLREKREYELTKKRKPFNSFKKYKRMELKLMKNADLSYFPSQVEIDIINTEDPDIQVKVLPPYIFRPLPKKERNFRNTKDLMFVGGFLHKPNVDGILWYLEEIYPVLNNKFPEIKTYILGSDTPAEIIKFNSKTVIVKGYVTDEQLIDYYKNCRLCIVPLRYGSGIKGKIIEAMYYQIPIVTTSIGAEGIKGAENVLLIKDEPESFAEEIVRVYDDLRLLSDISEKETDIINNTYTVNAAIDVISNDFCLVKDTLYA